MDVLIAEDDLLISRSLRALLERQGYTCAEAEDGLKAPVAEGEREILSVPARRPPLTIAQILVAIALTEGHVSRDQIRQMFGMDLVVTITGTAMALVSSILWIERPEATPILMIPILVAFLGYRAYVAERQGHEKVKFLYEANRTLSESPEVAIALEGLLERALEAFRAEQAEVILFSGDGGTPLRTGLGPGSAREAMVPVESAVGVA